MMVLSFVVLVLLLSPLRLITAAVSDDVPPSTAVVITHSTKSFGLMCSFAKTSLFYFNAQTSSLWQHLITLSFTGLVDTISKLSDNQQFIKNVSYSHVLRIVMSDEEAYILADYLLIISCGVHAITAIISCGVHAVAAIVALAQSIDSLL